MILTEFAPNETVKDAFMSLLTLVQPWRWKKGKEQLLVENKIENYFPGSKSFFFLTGRASLYILLSALNMKQKNEVIITGFTCEAVVLPIIKSGCKPVYVDIETDTLSIDFKKLLNKITPHTKVIILQHTFGIIPKYRSKVLELAKSKNIFVVEDLAHGFNPSNSHSLTPSDKTALILSFGRSKAVSCVFGGAVVLTNKNIIKSITKQISDTLKFPSLSYIGELLLYKPIAVFIKFASIFGLGKPLHYVAKRLRLLTAEITQKEKGGEYDIVFEKRFPNALAILLNFQLGRFSLNQKKRREIAHLYYKQLKSYGLSPSLTESALRFPILVKNRKHTLEEFKKHHILLGQWYNQPVAPYPLPLKKVGYLTGTCPVAEMICKQIINLPTTISKKEAELIIKYYKITEQKIPE